MKDNTSIEALVSDYKQNPNPDTMLRIWKKIQRFAYMKCDAAVKSFLPGEQIEDCLIECFLSLYNAVDCYNQTEEVSFLTYYSYHIKAALTKIYRKNGNYKLGTVISLDSELDPEDPDSETLLDLIEDERSALDFESEEFLEVINTFWNTVREKLKDIPNSEMILKFALKGGSIKELAEERGEEYSETYKKLRKATRESAIRLWPDKEALDEMETYISNRINYYLGTGLNSFKKYGNRGVESLAIKRMELENIYMSKAK